MWSVTWGEIGKYWSVNQEGWFGEPTTEIDQKDFEISLKHQNKKKNILSCKSYVNGNTNGMPAESQTNQL